MERAQYLPRLNGYIIAISLIWALHFFGILGLFWPPMNEALSAVTPFTSFLSLTPFNLMALGGLLIAFHAHWSTKQRIWAVGSALVGYGVEVLGVHTGVIFGEYAYGPVLGWKVADVPLLIGLNWMVLVYAAGSILSTLKMNDVVRAMSMATLMTLLDILIEPVAIYWDFWTWATEHVPLQNYIAWWIIAFLLSYAWVRLFKLESHKIAPHIWWAQVLFFLVNNLLMLS